MAPGGTRPAAGQSKGVAERHSSEEERRACAWNCGNAMPPSTHRRWHVPCPASGSGGRLHDADPASAKRPLTAMHDGDNAVDATLRPGTAELRRTARNRFPPTLPRPAADVAVVGMPGRGFGSPRLIINASRLRPFCERKTVPIGVPPPKKRAALPLKAKRLASVRA